MKAQALPLAALLLLTGQSGAEVGQTKDGSPCNRSDQVGYEEVNPDRLRDIEIVPLEFRDAVEESGGLHGASEVASPHGTARLLVGEQAEKGGGDRRTTIYFLTRSPKLSALKATFRHHSRDVRPRWINEKLAFVEVWWGRVRSTELIVDVEKGGSIYMQDADYFGMTLPPCE